MMKKLAFVGVAVAVLGVHTLMAATYYKVGGDPAGSSSFSTNVSDTVGWAIAPDAPLPIARISHDPREMQRVYDIGLCAGRSRLAAVAEFLQTRRPA